jgi:Holliday junction resolvase-like predicted endonuclease
MAGLVFVEVKTRRSDDAGRPSEAIDRAEQRERRGAGVFEIKPLAKLLGPV